MPLTYYCYVRTSIIVFSEIDTMYQCVCILYEKRGVIFILFLSSKETPSYTR